MLYQDLISCLYDNDQPLQGHNAYPKRKDFEKLRVHLYRQQGLHYAADGKYNGLPLFQNYSGP